MTHGLQTVYTDCVWSRLPRWLRQGIGWAMVLFLAVDLISAFLGR